MNETEQKPFSRELWTDQVGEGKTKVILGNPKEPDVVLVESKDNITKHDDPNQTQVMGGKAAYSTTTTCAVFQLLKAAGIPVAFERQVSETEFLAPRCKMTPLEVIARRFPVGSYLKRFPNLEGKKGSPPLRFHRLIFELFLKTTGGRILSKDGELRGTTPNDPDTGRPIDDPFILNPYDSVWDLRHPKHPSWDEKSDLHCPVFRQEILPEGVTVEMIEEITRRVFLILEGAWAQLGYRLIDFKIEFGTGPNGKLLVADVIDNDSWRVRTIDWLELSKQLFRDNAAMSKIADMYALVALLVGRFRIPKQAIVLWRGSDRDDLPDITEVAGVEKVGIVESGHKAPCTSASMLEEVLAEYPEGGVIIVPVGMSNGLGPTLAARTSWSVISVPTTARERPHDVWSSLEMPSQVPNLTVLSPKNAILAALNILARTNPAVYMARQYDIEQLDG